MNFYDSIGNRFVVLKDDWILDESCAKSIDSFINLLLNDQFEVQSSRYEYFTVVGFNDFRIVRDPKRTLRRTFIELKKKLGIKF